MSCVLKCIPNREYSHIIETDEGRRWYIDSAPRGLVGGSFETMVFPINSNYRNLDLKELIYEIQWRNPIYKKQYLHKQVMARKHNYLILHLEEVTRYKN